jgi:CPA1 family monovalent cation:H+ antiporter
VAAAISALFAFKLEQLGFAQANLMVSLTFLVIIGTVTFQSLTARPLALWLGVAEDKNRGLLIIGANSVARSIAIMLKSLGFNCLLTDSHWPNIRDARMDGLNVYYGHPISDDADQRLDLVGMGRMIALSQNDHLNVLAVQRYQTEFGKDNCYTLMPNGQRANSEKHGIASAWRGRILFGKDVNYRSLLELFNQGGKLHKTRLSDDFDFKDFQQKHQSDKVILLFALNSKNEMLIFQQEITFTPANGWTLISLHLPQNGLTQ